MNNVNQQIQNLTLVDFANMFKMTKDGEFATSVEKTNGRIYADKNGVVHNVDHALPTGKGDASANRRLREQLIAAFAKGNATAKFLDEAGRKLGLRPYSSQAADVEKPLDRRVVKQLLQDYRAGGFEITCSLKNGKDGLDLGEFAVFDAKPNVVQTYMDNYQATFETGIANVLNMKALSNVPEEVKNGECREILQTCFRKFAESTLAESGSLDGFGLFSHPGYVAMVSILNNNNEELGFAPLAMAISLPPREATAFLRAVALVPRTEYGMLNRFFAAAPEIARLPLSQFTVGNVLRLAGPEFSITDVKRQGWSPTKEQFEKICQPLKALQTKLNDLMKNALLNGKGVASRKYTGLTNLLFTEGVSVTDVKACLKDFKAFSLSMIPTVALQPRWGVRFRPLSSTFTLLNEDLFRNRPQIDILKKDGQLRHYNGGDMKIGGSPMLKELGDDVAELCGAKNLIQQQMVLLAMTQNAATGESGMNKLLGDGSDVPLGMQFALKRDEKTGDVLLSRQTPPLGNYGYSMTLRIRPDGSQSVVYLKSVNADVAPIPLDEYGHRLFADSVIKSWEPSTKKEVAEAKPYVAGCQKLLTQVDDLLRNYSDTISDKLKNALTKFASKGNQDFIVRCAKYLDSPGVNAKYVRSQISSLFNRVFARMPEDERKVFADFFSLVQGIEKTDYPGNTVVDTGYLTQLADYADLFNTKKSSYLPTAGREEQRTEIVLDVDKQEDFIEGLSALGSEIKALDLKFNRIEKQVQPQPVVEKQKKAPDAEVKMSQKKVEPKVKANKLSEDDDDQVNLTENASRYDIPEREIYEYDEY